VGVGSRGEIELRFPLQPHTAVFTGFLSGDGGEGGGGRRCWEHPEDDVV
jgi:hypothetical protein